TDGTGPLVELRGHQGGLSSAEFSPDGRLIVTASEDGTARVWRADGPDLPARLPVQEGKIFSVAFSPEREHDARPASVNGTARVWSPLIISASEDGAARVWPADGSSAPVVLQGHEGQVTSAAFSPDGQRILISSRDGTARVWRADGTGAPVVLRGHSDQVVSVAFSPDGQRLVTVSMDGTARVWNADGAEPLLMLRGQEEGISSAAFSPDGQGVITTSADGSARIWPLSISALRQALDEVNADCLPIELRRLYMDENDAVARWKYETCEQRHGRLSPSGR
ncbi:MAG TPA: WD40 repeat domain-containing protein, partial [Archangium sp.]|nr:WD40 repeat domain-containing protein [Archangium sp.]